MKKEIDYPYKTKGDTEVILAALEKKSLKWFLKRANGMFAIAIYDNKKNKLTLVYFIKPFFSYPYFTIIDSKTPSSSSNRQPNP